jgi:hypothetical protein
MKESISTLVLNKRYYRTKPFRGSIPYPLYQSYKENYNFDNIKNSVERWASYSENMGESLDKVLELFDIVSSKGTSKQLDTITDRINENIIFSLDDPSLLRPVISTKIKESNDVRKSCLASILGRINESIHCDRLIKNHLMISKRFNIDSYVRENAYGDNINDTIHELCSFIDTYNMGVNSKYSIALEEVLFTFYKNNVKANSASILEAVTDYFLSTHMNEEDSSRELLHILGETAAQNRFFTHEDACYIERLQSSIVETVEENTIDSLLESSLKDKTKDIIDKFKTLPSKTPEALKLMLINILVVNKDNNIVNGTKNLLSIAFYFLCVVGAISISVYAGIFAAIVAKTINFITERKYMTDILKVWYRNRDSVARKIDKCKDNKKKARLEEYLKQLDKSIDSLEGYSDSLRGDDEKKSWETKPDKGGDFNFNINFDEDAKIVATNIVVIESAVSSIKWDQKANEKVLFSSNNIVEMQLEDVDFLTEFCVKYPHMLSKDKFIEALQFADKQASINGIINYNKINCYAENISKLMSSDVEDISNMNSFDSFDNIFSIDTEVEENLFSQLNELYEYTNSINSYVQSINELSLTSNLKLAVQKLSKVVSNLSDKEKIMSRSVDSACAMVSRSVEKAMTMENREAVIRGDILPQASKVIKMAIVTAGAAWLIHPAAALILLLGRFAMNSRIRTKERQLVLDELDVELTMVDKYIAIAEDNKDMKRLRELLLLKKKLQAQDARLRYKIKLEWDDNNVKPLGKEND